MDKKIEIDNIAVLLRSWLAEIKFNTKLGYYDINKISEGLSAKLLNAIFDYQLVDLEKEKKDYPAIDLGDDIHDKIAFQVTSRTDFKKFKGNIETFIKKNKDNKCLADTFTNGIKFLVISTENIKTGKISLDTIYPKFNAEKDIIRLLDLLPIISDIYDKNRETFNLIKSILEDQFSNKENKQLIQASSNPRIKYVRLPRNTTKAEIDKVKKILELINWTKCPSKKIECVNEKKHQTEDDTKEHHFDFVCKQQSKLVDNTDNASVISIVKTDNYQTGNKFKRELYSYLLDLSQSTECAIDSDFIAKSAKNRRTEIASILVWLSEGDNKEFIYEIPHIYDKFEYKHLIDEPIFFIIDESRLNFIKNSINTVKYYNSDKTIKFLYPLTAHNSQLNKIESRGFQFPYQLLNSTILPIIVEEKKKSFVYIFCYDKYESKELKRLIWLTFMITAGFASEYKILFPDYDENKDENEANEIINSVNDEIFRSRINIEKYQDFPDEVLLENPNINLTKVQHKTYEHDTDKPFSLGAELIDTLIYGDKLQSVLNSSSLSASDLKLFLAQRGIILKTNDKKEILPFISTLLFSPREIDTLKKLMVDKEKKVKDVQQNPVEWKSTENLKNTYNIAKPNFTDIEEKYNFVKPLKVNFISENEFDFDFKIKQENRLEGVYEGTSFPSGKVNCKLDNNFLDTNYSYQSSEPAKACREIIKECQLALKDNKAIEQEAKVIMFSDFDDNNASRVEFLMSFENYSNSLHFKDCNTVNIKLRPDNDTELPDDLEKMRGKVKQLNIDGNNLNDLDYVYKTEYKNSILLERIKIRYKFDFRNLENQHCVVEYGFSNALISKINDGKFQTSLQIVLSDKIKTTTNYNSIERELKKEVKKLVLEKYEIYKQFLDNDVDKNDILNNLID